MRSSLLKIQDGVLTQQNRLCVCVWCYVREREGDIESCTKDKICILVIGDNKSNNITKEEKGALYRSYSLWQ